MPRLVYRLRACLCLAGMAAALFAASGAALAASGTVAGAMFDVPDGWAATPPADGKDWIGRRTFIGPDGRKAGAALMEVTRPLAPAGADLPAIAARLVTGAMPELAREKPFARGQGTSLTGHPMAFELRCCARRNDASISADTVAVSDGPTVRVLMLVGVGLGSDAAKQARADFDALVRSLRLHEADPAPVLVPPPKAGGLDGVFTHLSTGLRPNPFGGVDFRADNEVRVFDRSGLWSHVIPGTGEDVAAHCQATPADCGTYRLVGGDRIEMASVQPRFGMIETETQAFARDGEDLSIGGGAFRRVPPLPRDTRLNGTWRFFFAAVGNTAFSSNSVSSERLLTLTPDGRFRRTGWSGASSTNSAGGGTTGVTVGGPRAGAAGRYEADGFTLRLLPDGGAAETLSLFRPEPGSDGLLVIDGRNYLKQGKT